MALGTGIDEYILKVASWCNLDCTYCYYYHGADTSFLGRPREIGMDVVDALVPKIIAHCEAHGIDRIRVDLHGGEPLLISKSKFDAIVERLADVSRAGIRVTHKMTTNGVLLDDEWARLLAAHRFHLAVSIDGPREVHDRARVDHAGRGSYDRVVRGLRTALAWRDRGLGVAVLSVIDPAASGRETYRHLRSLGVDVMNFLLPECNHAHPPAGYAPDGPGAPYADFLNEVFDEWTAEDDERVRVGLLSEVVQGVVGQRPQSDQFGSAPVRVAVVETDGSLEPTDNFKACADRMTDLGLDVFRHTFDDLYFDDFFKHCVDTSGQLPPECRGCAFVQTCAGGPISTRYSATDGFARRTVYCKEFLSVFQHVRGWLRAHEVV